VVRWGGQPKERGEGVKLGWERTVCSDSEKEGETYTQTSEKEVVEGNGLREKREEKASADIAHGSKAEKKSEENKWKVQMGKRGSGLMNEKQSKRSRRREKLELRNIS